MSARTPARRLGIYALAFRPRSMPTTSTPSRSISLFSKKKDTPDGKEIEKDGKIKDAPDVDPNDPLANPMMDRYLSKHDPSKKPKLPETRMGTISEHPTSLLKPEYELPGYREGMKPRELKALKETDERRKKAVEVERERYLKAQMLDPAPEARRRLQRRLVIKDVSRLQRVSKGLKIARTERKSHFNSTLMPISTKKLQRITKLIAGKTVEEALVQLRFSKKRIARDVLKYLQFARDQAIALRGMGLGASSSPMTSRRQNTYVNKLAQTAADEATAKAKEAGLEEEAVKMAAQKAKREVLLANREQASEPYLADGSDIRAWPKNGQLIELKDGSKKRVHDPTEMYIDQAWVNKGRAAQTPEFRARGRINMLTHRTARFTVLLKEEKTRLRISEEIKKKRDNRKLWVPLEDRPVITQRQYCLW